MDRLCATTKNGALHFFILNNTENEDCDEHDEEDSINMDSDNSHSQQNFTNADLSSCFLKPPNIISLNQMKILKLLSAFEPLRTGYCVVVPPCWSEFQQALRQRRQPQSHKTEEQHTKTWRLQTDTTTWDEHIFEIALPSSTHLGHIDVHFTLQVRLSPSIVVVLLPLMWLKILLFTLTNIGY